MLARQFQVGDTGSTTARTIIQSDVVNFGGLTGDFSALHFDQQITTNSDKGTIAHGLLGATLCLGALSQSVPELLAEDDPSALLSRFSVHYRHPIFVGDSLTTHWRVLSVNERLELHYHATNQTGVSCCDGQLSITNEACVRTPPVWPVSADPLPEKAIWYLDDYHDFKVTGETRGRSFTEADIQQYTGISGDYNPLYLDLTHAAQGRFGARIVPPLLCFNVAFASWLRLWMRLPMPDSSFAGHLCDQWQQHAPVFIGDTLSCRFRCLDLRVSRTKRDRGILTFGLQIINQHGVLVQSGEVLMMYPHKPDAC